MYEEQSYPPDLDFNLSRYQLDEAGLIANVEQAREVIRNLQGIIHFLQVSPFAQLPLHTQAEISLYLVGTHLLTHSSGHPREEKAAALETLFNEQFDALVRGGKSALDSEEVLHGVEEMFRDFGV